MLYGNLYRDNLTLNIFVNITEYCSILYTKLQWSGLQMSRDDHGSSYVAAATAWTCGVPARARAWRRLRFSKFVAGGAGVGGTQCRPGGPGARNTLALLLSTPRPSLGRSPGHNLNAGELEESLTVTRRRKGSTLPGIYRAAACGAVEYRSHQPEDHCIVRCHCSPGRGSRGPKSVPA